MKMLLTVAFTAWAMLASPAFAASVTSVSKGSGVVKIDEVHDKGEAICFFKGKTQVACGKVVKKGKGESFIKLDKKKIKKISKGMNAQLEGETTTNSAAKGAEAPQIGPYNMAFYGIYNPSILGPSYFNTDVIYAAPDNTNAATTLFDSAPQSITLISFGAQFDMFLSYPYGVMAGFRTRIYSFHTHMESNYKQGDNTDADYVKTSQGANSFGVYASGTYYYSLGEDSGLKLAGGLDIDMSKVKITAGEFNGAFGSDPATHEERGQLYELTSQLTVISLKVDALYSMVISKPFVLDAGISLFLPVSSSRSGTPTVTDPNVAANPGVDPKTDLVNAVDHKAVFGFELLFAAGYSF
jgi:hypothetical protein